MNAIQMIAIERQKQIENGKTPEYDAKENSGDALISAAVAMIRDGEGYFGGFPVDWQDSVCTKLLDKPLKERLVIAGAFIVAELEAMQYREDLEAKKVKAAEKEEPVTTGSLQQLIEKRAAEKLNNALNDFCRSMRDNYLVNKAGINGEACRGVKLYPVVNVEYNYRKENAKEVVGNLYDRVSVDWFLCGSGAGTFRQLAFDQLLPEWIENETKEILKSVETKTNHDVKSREGREVLDAFSNLGEDAKKAIIVTLEMSGDEESAEIVKRYTEPRKKER